MDRNAPWRMTQYHGEWWYFTPDEQWMYHRNGRWQTYSASTFRRPNWIGRYGQGQGNMVDSGRRIVGYRGYETMNGDYGPTMQGTGPVYLLRYDASGREFICVNGQPVYFDTQPGQGQQPTPAEAGVDSTETPDDAPPSTEDSDVSSPSDAPRTDNPPDDPGSET
jgi:hypothetical protein